METLKDLIYPWQHQHWSRVVRAWAQDRFPHALLLEGQEGLGKRGFASALARFTLCEQADPSSRPCGACRGCALAIAGTHPDALAVQPEEDRKLIGVEQIRDLCADLSLTSHAGGFKAAIITPADCMTLSAANSLLKTLEEPPGQTLLILVSNNLHPLPATVASRCQRLAFTAPPREQALQWLTSQDAAHDWDRMLDFAGAAPLRALALARDGFADLDRKLGLELTGLLTGEVDPVCLADTWRKRDVRLCLDWLAGYCALQIKTSFAAPDAEMGTMHLHLGFKNIHLGSLFRYLDQLGEARAALDGSVNQHLLLESLLIPWAHGLRDGKAVE